MSLQAFLSTPVYTSWDVHCSLQTFLSTPHTSWDVQCLTGRVFKVEPYSFAYGGHSEIWKGTLKHEHSENNLNVAVKVIKGFQDPVTAKRILREASIWSTLNHPHITPFLGVTFDFDRPQTPCLISPYYANGNIQQYIEKNPGVNKLPLISQIASALEYLHDHNVIHGDIMPGHILVNDEGDAKISDFGLSRVLDISGFATTSGPWRFMSPELLKICEEEEFNPSMVRGWRCKAPERMTVSPNEADEFIPRVTKATDVWEFSMTVFEILSGTMPFFNIKRDASVIHFVMSGGRPKRSQCNQISNEIWKVLERCWCTDPVQRPSMMSLSTFFGSQTVGRARL